MKAKRLLGLVVALVVTLSCRAFAEAPHRHNWYDDIENSTEHINV